MSAHSAGAYTATLLVLVNVMRGGGRAPPPTPARTNFTVMTECTPESSGFNSVYSGVDGQTVICFDRSVLQAPNESYLQTIIKRMKEKIDYLPLENAKKTLGVNDEFL